MEKIARFILHHKKTVLIVFAVALIASAIMSRLTTVNYEMSDYLPDTMNTKRAVNVMRDEFGIPSNVRVMVEGVEIYEALEMKEKLLAHDNISRVTWLDDVTDVYVPVEYIGSNFKDRYYKDGTALFYVDIDTSEYSLETGDTLNDIQAIIGESGTIYGGASSGAEIRTSSTSQIGMMITILLPVILLVLLFATSSWAEPFVFLIVLGVAILINNGTNAFLGGISFVTQSMSTALQLAISMDYSIFLLHRFSEERAAGNDIEQSMQNAMVKSFSAITSSSVTTIAGFLALVFMQFKIGTDMGIVFAKGILLSLIAVLVLLPVLTIYFAKIIEKTHHRDFLPSFKKVGQLVYKIRYAIIIVVVIVIIPAFMGQRANDFVYGGSTISASEESPSFQAKSKIDAIYGTYNPIVLLVPKGDYTKERSLADELLQHPNITDVQGIAAVADIAMPRDILPERLISQFEGDNYARIIANLNLPEESKETFAAIEYAEQLAEKYYGDAFYLTGLSASTLDIKRAADLDYIMVNALAILAVFIILLLTFRSLILPIILIIAIQAAIYLNMSVPYFSGYSMSFIGYLVVSALQLGATIDYAILLTSRYIERRKNINKRVAIIGAIEDAGGSILTSGGILAIAGIIIGTVSSVETVGEMGMLIGRGALLSMLMVFLLLPALLVLFDRFIKIKKPQKHSSNTETEVAYD